MPGGFITSGCSPIVYTADAFPEEYRSNTIMCDPANNLMHRDRLEQNGSVFKAVRADLKSEFLASTDNWFRPVALAIGPDGALYVADFYREAIETPLSLPEDIKKQVNVETCGRGRIWRISRQGHGPGAHPDLSRQSSAELVGALVRPNPWWRLTAQRLLVERQAKEVVPALIKLAESSALPQGKAHALWTLQGLDALPVNAVLKGLSDASAGVRIQALILAEPLAAKSPAVRAKLAEAAKDTDSMVRFQAALSLGAVSSDERTSALGELLQRADSDSWTITAALSSANGQEIALLKQLMNASSSQGAGAKRTAEVVRRLAALVATKGVESELATCLGMVSSKEAKPSPLQPALIEGISDGLTRSGHSLKSWWNKPPRGLEAGIDSLRQLMVQAGKTARDAKQSLERRESAVRLLRSAPY
ncbi:hypothetical protein BH10PLA2_BH10PLA2_27910 [soil metagenome]